MRSTDETRPRGAIRLGLLAHVALITAGFAALYPLLRSLPDTECAFLHYDYVGERADGTGTELCGSSDNAVFFDLERISFPVKMNLAPLGRAQAGGPVPAALVLETIAGRPLGAGELAVVHEEKIHLFITGPELGDYHHVHPTPDPDGPPGRFRFAFTPRRTGTYQIFAELVPQSSRSMVIARGVIEVEGAADDTGAGGGGVAGGDPAAGVPGLPGGKSDRRHEVAGYRFELLFPAGAPGLNRDNDISLTISRVPGAGGDDRPIGFAKVMGAYAHLVAFDRSGRGLAHMHPLDGGVGLDTARPRFGFTFNTSLAGSYRVWAQVLIDGAERFIPFDIEVR